MRGYRCPGPMGAYLAPAPGPCLVAEAVTETQHQLRGPKIGFPGAAALELGGKVRIAELAFRKQRPVLVQPILQSTQDLGRPAGKLVLPGILAWKGFEFDFDMGDGGPAADTEVGHEPAVAERAEAVEQIEHQQIVAVGEFQVPVDGVSCEM